MLVLLASAASVAALATRCRPAWAWVFAILVLAALLWPWPLALYLGLDHYTIRAALHISAGTSVAVAAGTVWGMISRRAVARSSMLAIALLPWLGGAVFVLERQRVPEAPCAERALFRVGDVTIAVPREMRARSVWADGAPEQAWQGSYSAWPGAKPEVRALCRVTEGGREVLPVSHLWFPVSWLRQRHEPGCGPGLVPEQRRAYCAAIARTRLTIVQLYARPDQLPSPALSYFNPKQVIRALSEGKRAGYRCGKGTGPSTTRYCTIWLQLTPAVLAVAAAKLGTATDDEDPVGDAAVVLETLLSDLRPKASVPASG